VISIDFLAEYNQFVQFVSHLCQFIIPMTYVQSACNFPIAYAIWFVDQNCSVLPVSLDYYDLETISKYTLQMLSRIYILISDLYVTEIC